MTLSMLVIFYLLITEIVSEKENKLQEAMKMMGLLDGVYWLSHFLVSFFFYLFTLLISLAIIQGMGVYRFSSYNSILLLYWLYSCSLITMSFLISNFISRAKFSGLFGSFIILSLSAIGIVVEGKLKLT